MIIYINEVYLKEMQVLLIISKYNGIQFIFYL